MALFWELFESSQVDKSAWLFDNALEQHLSFDEPRAWRTTLGTDTGHTTSLWLSPLILIHIKQTEHLCPSYTCHFKKHSITSDTCYKMAVRKHHIWPSKSFSLQIDWLYHNCVSCISNNRDSLPWLRESNVRVMHLGLSVCLSVRVRNSKTSAPIYLIPPPPQEVLYPSLGPPLRWSGTGQKNWLKDSSPLRGRINDVIQVWHNDVRHYEKCVTTSRVCRRLKVCHLWLPCLVMFQTGYMFGKGVYFADMVSKSANYCRVSKSEPVGLLMLCEVALGNM